MLGDTAIAVNPNDDRYKKFHGKFVIHPFNVIDCVEGCSLENLHKQLYNGILNEKEIELAIKLQKKQFPNGIPECGNFKKNKIK
jgi:hypothetical protein